MTIPDALLHRTRRHFFQTCGFGIGSLGAGLCHESTAVRTSPGGKSAAFCPESEEHYLSVHGRRPVAARFIRQQTSIKEVRRPNPVRRTSSRESGSPLSEAYRNYWVRLTNSGKLGKVAPVVGLTSATRDGG